MKRLTKSAIFTDLHLGRKANSSIHNQDCVDYVNWFCRNVEEDSSIDSILFLGDWNENRSAINISTLNYSHKCARRIDDLNLPVYFVVGNHDLYHRHTREVHSIVTHSEFRNFTIVEEPTVFKHIGDGLLMCPYMFHNEYNSLLKYTDIPIWAGHFEFRGFVITGYNITMPTGPDPKDFQDPKHIISGHFHKRQANENVVYIGNAFPMDFGDAGDFGRGMTTYDFVSDEMLFHDWEDCPKYIKTKLTDILDNTVTLHPNARVKCLVDIPLSFEENNYLRQHFTDKYHLREFTLEESTEIQGALSDTEAEIDWEENKLADVNDLVLQMLRGIESEHIDNQKLVEIYQSLK